jgi:peptidoglycan biosynthesis protein MviN/MurJ (putative lipid II flippase)
MINATSMLLAGVVLIAVLSSGTRLYSVDLTLAAKVAASLAPLPIVAAGSSVLAATLYARNRFAVGTMTQSLRALLPTLLLVSGARPDLSQVGLAMTAGELLRLAILVWGSGLRHSQATRGIFSKNDRYWATLLPLYISMLVASANPLIDRAFAATLSLGSITSLELTEKVFYIPSALFSGMIALVVGSAWAQAAARSPTSLNSDYWRTQRIVSLASIAFTLLAIIGVHFYGDSTLALLGIANIQGFSSLLGIFLVGLPFTFVTALGGRLFTTLGRSRLQLLFAVTVLVVNILGDLIGMHLWQLAGIAVASTGVRIVSALLFLVYSPGVLAGGANPQVARLPIGLGMYRRKASLDGQ